MVLLSKYVQTAINLRNWTELIENKKGGQEWPPVLSTLNINLFYIPENFGSKIIF
jgi:hypothetical protein